MIEDKNEREWQAYYEMLFHKKLPQIPEIYSFNKYFFAQKALKYYNTMSEDSELHLKYTNQKLETNNLLSFLEAKTK